MSSTRPSEIPRAEERPNLGKLLASTYTALALELDDRLAAAGFGDVRPSHGTVFGVVDAEGSRVTELAARAGMSKQAMGELVDHLEAAGYVTRAPDPRDRRARLVQLTRRGWECIAAGRRIVEELEREWGERYGSGRVAALRTALEELDAARRPAATVDAADR
jgi:DNA-binding MarR family transcriptional regulator